MKQTNLLFRQQLNITSEKALHWCGRSLVKLYSRAVLKMDMYWHTPLRPGPKIIAANHPTTTDPFYILSLLSEPVSILITAATFEIPGFGLLLRAMGHIPAIRNSNGATIEDIVQKVESGRTVAIFPEGTLSPLSGGFNKPHSGVARVALRTGAPVIPIGIGLQRDRIRVTETEIGGEKQSVIFILKVPMP